MSTVTTLMVPGMTCGHCVSSVTKELQAVAGVENVSVELRKEAESEVTVFSDNPLAEDALREAIDEAGYEVASIATQTSTEVNSELGLSAKGSADGGCGCGNCGCQ